MLFPFSRLTVSLLNGVLRDITEKLLDNGQTGNDLPHESSTKLKHFVTKLYFDIQNKHCEPGSTHYVQLTEDNNGKIANYAGILNQVFHRIESVNLSMF